ncbi:MAG: hypothetical protein KME19_23940 [Microcoleus vaginatus WJT46-NPBG5]|jgi:hypothetical protein|nr:hypothetical protein [Microcoleus vaginatus WJT46-NPBG5]
MKKISLVFRTVGERTSNIALDLAIQNIQPDQVHIIDRVKPFSLAVQQMLKIDYHCDFVVFMDADCLIVENLAPFLQKNNAPYVDCYVLDKFRGYIHCGVHIARIDVVKAMQNIKEPKDDPKYVLRPESRIRDLAMNQLNFKKDFKRFNIFHDFCQYYRDIFAKYALRELRSRTDYQRAKLNFIQEDWEMQDENLDFQVAKLAISYAREYLRCDASVKETAKFIENLPNIAICELNKKNISEKHDLTLKEVENLSKTFKAKSEIPRKTYKIFGIGLSQTGTRYLAQALTTLGFSVIHSPDDDLTLKELLTGKYNFSILDDFDGITDITVAPFYPQLDRLSPNSKFILTLVSDKESWLKSLEAQWNMQPGEDLLSEQDRNMQYRRLLRVATYGTYSFNKERFSYVYDLHCKNVIDYFKDRPESLLILNADTGEGWERLSAFLNQPLLDNPFKSKGSTKGKIKQELYN